MTSLPKRKDESIKTYLRIKPTPLFQQSFLTSITSTSVTIRSQEQYTYDRVFDAQSTNRDIFQQIGSPLIRHSLEGYNACVLAYGQTSSGKTYTMKGNQENQGVIPLTLRQLFRTIEEKKLLAEIRISYLQIYNENIIDLLNSTQTYLQIREDPRKNITILGLIQQKVSTVDEAMKLFQQGESRRKFASNNLNIASSRSHAIFRMNVEVVHEDFSKTGSCINMVDLAGSEGVSRTKAQGNAKKEGENINKSILALSNVIRCMSQKQGYVNFRDSKLTRILQSSLCNNSRSVVICNIYPTALNYQQTINTLKFGMYASQVKLQLKRNISQTTLKQPRQHFTQPKSATHPEHFQPQQRIQYIQNKKTIEKLRQQNQQLRDYKRILNTKIEFLELENHRLAKQVQISEEKLRNKRVEPKVFEVVSNQERNHYEKRLRDLNEKMEVMADQYQAINQYSMKLEKNQRYLIQRITRYESEIALLKETLDTKQAQLTTKNKPKTPIKQKHFRPPLRESKQQICPLTIKSIIILRAQIIELKQDIFAMNQDIAGLVQERNQLLGEIQGFRDREGKGRGDGDGDREEGGNDVQKKEIKSLHIRIKKLKNQVQLGKNREKKLAKLLKACSQTMLEQFDQFNEWYAEKKKRLDSIKKQKSGSARKSVKQNQQAQQ